jgi:hypothetical protein
MALSLEVRNDPCLHKSFVPEDSVTAELYAARSWTLNVPAQPDWMPLYRHAELEELHRHLLSHQQSATRRDDRTARCAP